MRELTKRVAALFALFALYGVRAWIVLAAAFFGVALLRGIPSAWQEREWLDVGLLMAIGGLLLVISYRWFAARWASAPIKSKNNAGDHAT